VDRALRSAACVLAVGMLSVAAGLSPAQAWSGNLLKNPGFENADADWWGYAWYGEPEPYPDAHAAAENPHSGSYALKVGASAGGRAQSPCCPKNSSAPQSGLTAPRILATPDGSKCSRTPG